jgi:hypothetical protein
MRNEIRLRKEKYEEHCSTRQEWEMGNEFRVVTASVSISLRRNKNGKLSMMHVTTLRGSAFCAKHSNEKIISNMQYCFVIT